MKKLDTYQQWVKEGKADAYLSSIRRWVSDNATQKQIANNLHITEKTLISMKQKHKEIRDAFAEGDDILKVELENSILKRARGMKLEDEVQTFEIIDGGKRKQKIVKTKKEIPPDTQAAIYLLQVKFGRTYNPRKDQIDILEKKAEGDVWVDEPDEELIELNQELVKAKNTVRKKRIRRQIDELNNPDSEDDNDA
ncbi:MAG: hypothetical protein J5511_04745 [Bacilli bacterium]|nr:hypothetical protein [Bacilli bacterium]